MTSKSQIKRLERLLGQKARTSFDPEAILRQLELGHITYRQLSTPDLLALMDYLPGDSSTDISSMSMEELEAFLVEMEDQDGTGTP